MEFEDKLALSLYKECTLIDEDKGVLLAQNIETKELFVKKVLNTFSLDVYRKLENHHFPRTPKIQLLVEDVDSLIVIEEYIHGQSLERLISSGYQFSPKKAGAIVVALCKILKPLHSQSPPIIHRDIKPSNIIIDKNSNISLIDFGASKESSGSKNSDTELIGTVGFAAPEQYGFGESTPATDIYALGVLLHLLLLGRLPREEDLDKGAGAENTNGRSSEESPLPKSFNRILSTALAMDPKKRFGSVEAFGAAVNKAFVVQPTPQGEVSSKLSKLGIPGFRTRKSWKTCIAIFAYVTILPFSFYMLLSKPAQGTDYLYNLAAFIMIIGGLMFYTNFLNIWSKLPLCQSPLIFAKIIGGLLWPSAFLLGILLILVFLEDALPGIVNVI